MIKQNTNEQRKRAKRKRNRNRKIRNALRISIMLLTIGILILVILVLVGFFGKDAGSVNLTGFQLNQTADVNQNNKLLGQQVDLSNFEFSNDALEAIQGKKIVIDAGHGGTDSGAIGPKTGVYESKLNMQVASRMEQVLSSLGAKVVMTRENTGSLENPSDKGLTWEQRGTIIQNAKADLLLSIHHNYSETSTKIQGVQVLYRENKSKDLAIALQDSYNKTLNLQMDYLQEKYRVLSYGTLPGVIIECGFLSTREEEKNIQTPEYQDWLVKTTVQTVAEYFIQLQ